jgi:hypothetical protein
VQALIAWARHGPPQGASDQARRYRGTAARRARLFSPLIAGVELTGCRGQTARR